MDYIISKFSFAKSELNYIENKARIDLIKLKQTELPKSSLDINQITELILVGFTLDQILFVIKEFKISTLESAMFLMTKDAISKYYNHSYYPNLKNVCKVCNDNDKEAHTLYTSNLDDIMNSKLINKEIKINNKIDTSKDTTLIKNNLTNINSNIKNFNDSSCNLKISNLLESKINLDDYRFKHKNIEYLFNCKNKDFDNNNNNNITSIASNNSLSKLNNKYIKSNEIDMNYSYDDEDLCEICWERKKDSFLTKRCTHKFCNYCVYSYLKLKIESGNVINIKCLYGGCPVVFTEEEIVKHLTNDLLKKYRKFKNEKLKLISKINNYVYCPYIDCDSLVKNNDINCLYLICENNHNFCKKCKKSPHGSKKCEEMNKSLLESLSKELKNMNKYKLCPECFIVIEKENGCNHMTCNYCYYEFCWLCLKAYSNDHYSYFNYNGCPGMLYRNIKGNNI